MARVKIDGLKCERCGYEWVPRAGHPKVCPHCKSPWWDTPRQNKKQGGKKA